ncbi:TPA: glycosyltransferase family 2 protein [Candidatus Bathyarchaeota archaeon]|nr:glycosyltransferase family 2 protein [Candidatus Bathyarchaeota archaeon]
MQAPLVSVIVLNYNGKEYIERCLRSVLDNDYPCFEVILVDNASTDGSVELAERLFGSDPRLRIVRNERNLGFCVGYNIGFKLAKGKYVIALNQDTEVQRGFIRELVKVAESDDTVASVGCRVVQPDGTILYRPLFTRSGIILKIPHLPSLYERPMTNLANCGCASLYRKSVIDEIGGFDPLFWMDREDHDLGYRVNLCGFRSVFTPTTTVKHWGGGAYKGMGLGRYVRICRNILFTYFKNYEAKNLVLRLPMAVAYLFVIRLFKLIFNELGIMGKVTLLERRTPRSETRKEFLAFFGGLLAFLRDLRPVVAERARVQSLRTTPDSYIFSVTKL